jgi:hypothetical protein
MGWGFWSKGAGWATSWNRKSILMGKVVAFRQFRFRSMRDVGQQALSTL